MTVKIYYLIYFLERNQGNPQNDIHMFLLLNIFHLYKRRDKCSLSQHRA
jgi:hypothetical protein